MTTKAVLDLCVLGRVERDIKLAQHSGTRLGNQQQEKTNTVICIVSGGGRGSLECTSDRTLPTLPLALHFTPPLCSCHLAENKEGSIYPGVAAVWAEGPGKMDKVASLENGSVRKSVMR